MTQLEVEDATEEPSSDDTANSDVSYLEARALSRDHGTGPYLWVYKKTDLPVGPHAPLEFSKWDDPHLSMSLAPGEHLPGRGRRGGFYERKGSRPRGKHVQPRKMNRHELEIKRLQNIQKRDRTLIPRDIMVGRHYKVERLAPAADPAQPDVRPPGEEATGWTEHWADTDLVQTFVRVPYPIQPVVTVWGDVGSHERARHFNRKYRPCLMLFS